MIELVKKALLTGVGVAALSKEKIEDLAKDIVEKGKMTEQEGKKLVEQLLSSSEDARQDLQKQIDGSLIEFFQKEARFMSHLTIARVKKIPDKKSLIDYGFRLASAFWSRSYASF